MVARLCVHEGGEKGKPKSQIERVRNGGEESA